MFYPIRAVLPWLALLLSSTSLFLSSWIVIPAPTMSLLPLGVGVPEVSPWLVVLNVIAVGVSWLGGHQSWLQRWTLGASLLGLVLSILPLVQLPATEQQMSGVMRDSLGANYEQQIPPSVQIQLRPHPFILADAFRGIPQLPVRYTPDIQFAAPDGVPLNLNIYRPPQVGQYPAIVIIYGGGWQSGSASHYADFSRYMAHRGYTVFAIAYRHAPRYQFPAQLDDVRAALTFIQQHATEYETDISRIALLGRSAGGHLAMLTAYQPDALPVRAVVSYYGPFNLTQGYRDPPKPDPYNVRAVLESFLGGSPDEQPEKYVKASPITYVTRPLPPTLLVHGSRDHIVEVRFARNMHKRLLAAQSKAILLEIPWAEHAFDAIFHGPSNQLALYYTERFLAWALH
ncbi:alpha/beta hydrolase [Microcoleus sp. ZQ-A2]|nr:alpha/beta hydrolase [Microcoleus sp. FACHB-1]